MCAGAHIAICILVTSWLSNVKLYIQCMCLSMSLTVLQFLVKSIPDETVLTKVNIYGPKTETNNKQSLCTL